MRLFSILADGGSSEAANGDHYECRACGQNVDPDETTCPNCGGAIAVFTF
jgi:rubrerythrin